MDNRCELVFLKNDIKCGAIPQIDFIERRPLPCDFRDTLQNRGPAVGEVIYNNRVIAHGNKSDNSMASDIAGSTGDKDYGLRGFYKTSHGVHPFLVFALYVFILYHSPRNLI
jgi:hypothetical protein